MTESASDPLAGIPWRELALAALPVGAVAYLPPATASWLYDGTTHLPFVPAVVGTLHIATTGAWGDPASAYPPGIRMHLPPPADWWITMTWLAITVGALVLAAFRHVEPSIARPRLGRRHYDPRGARPRTWARRRDLRAQAASGAIPDRFSLGKLDGRRLASDPEAHVALIAPTRSGKTTRLVIPWLLEHHGPVIVTSTKTDVLVATIDHRANKGTVHVFDPFGPNSSPWSPLHGCDDWSYSLRQARWLTGAARNDEGRGSEGAAFWRGQAAKLLAPLLHATALTSGSVADLLKAIDTGDVSLAAQILETQANDAARDQLLAVTNLDDRNRANVFITASSILDAYRHPELHHATGPAITANTFLDDSPRTLYVVAAEHHQQLLAPIIVALLSSILYAAADRANREGPPVNTVRLLIDEAANIAPLHDLPRHLSQAAGHGVRIASVWQTVAQLRDRYHHGADTILANSTTKLFMGPITDQGTRDYLNALLGEETTTNLGATVDPNTGQTRARTITSARRPKATAQDLQQLTRDRAVLFQGDATPAGSVRGSV